MSKSETFICECNQGQSCQVCDPVLEPIKQNLPPLHLLSIPELRELAMRDCSEYSDDDLAIAWELFDRLVEGDRIVEPDPQPAESHVERARRIVDSWPEWKRNYALTKHDVKPTQPADPAQEVDPIDIDNEAAANQACNVLVGLGYAWNGKDWVAMLAATPAQEPVGDIDKHEMESLTRNGVSVTVYPSENIETIPVYMAPQPAEPVSTGPCSLGVGCEEYGVCYAEAHDQPEKCGKLDPPTAPAQEPSDDAIDVLKMALEYWADRQQRYRNRAPVWVQEARSLLARYGSKS